MNKGHEIFLPFQHADHKKPAVKIENQYRKSKGAPDGVESIMKNLDKTYIKVESDFSHGQHEIFGGFSRPFHSTSN